METASFLVLLFFSQQPDPRAAVPHLYDPYRSHRLNPDFHLKRDTSGRRIHSQDGFRRDTPVTKKKKVNTIRIIALGGSALYGIGSGAPYPYHPALRNDETITCFLQQMINKRLKDDEMNLTAEVINAGVTAYETFQHLVYLNSVLLEYEPDWVINIDGENDFYRYDPDHNHWMDYGYSSARLIDLVNHRSGFLSMHLFIRSLAPYSQVFRLMEKFSKKRLQDMMHGENPSEKQRDSFSAEGYLATARRTFVRALWQIHNLGRLEGYDHLVFLQPKLLFEDNLLLSEHDRTIKDITRGKREPEYVETMGQMRGILPLLFEEHGIPFYDMGELGPFNKDRSDLYLDYCHLTPEGSKALAERICDVLYPGIREKCQTEDLPN